MAIDYWTELTYHNAYNCGVRTKRQIIELLIKDHFMTEEEAKAFTKYW